MEKNPSYFLIQKEKRNLETKQLFSFLLEQVQPKEVFICGESLEILKLPEFVFMEEKGILKKYRNKLYQALLDKKMKRLNEITTKKFPMKVVEACLIEFLKKECAFRRNTRVLIVDKSTIELRDLLLPYCNNLNYLELFVEEKEDYEYLAEELYEESGLAVTFTIFEGNESIKTSGEELETKEKYHIIIDLREDFIIPWNKLEKGCVYFDGSSSEEKERQIRRTGAGATYVSPRIYLDRALKSTV